MLRARTWPLLAALASIAGAASLGAQAASAPPPLDFSGVIFGSYNFQQSTTPNPLNRQIDNAFIVDRAYLTFRMNAGDHTSIRITTDVYQTSEGTPNAYTLRAKYAYLQYAGTKIGSVRPNSAVARLARHMTPRISAFARYSTSHGSRNAVDQNNQA